MESSQWENWYHLFCRKVSFLTAPHCQFRDVGQGMKQTYLYTKLYCVCKAVTEEISHHMQNKRWGGCWIASWNTLFPSFSQVIKSLCYVGFILTLYVWLNISYIHCMIKWIMSLYWMMYISHLIYFPSKWTEINWCWSLPINKKLEKEKTTYFSYVFRIIIRLSYHFKTPSSLPNK
jgi:hypothetical protein